MKAEKVLVMITTTWLNQTASTKWNIMATKSPPRIAAVILANRCHGDGVKYFLLAGMVQNRIISKNRPRIKVNESET